MQNCWSSTGLRRASLYVCAASPATSLSHHAGFDADIPVQFYYTLDVHTYDGGQPVATRLSPFLVGTLQEGQAWPGPADSSRPNFILQYQRRVSGWGGEKRVSGWGGKKRAWLDPADSSCCPNSKVRLMKREESFIPGKSLR